MLYELPNGDWIDLEYVTAVLYGEPIEIEHSKGHFSAHKPRAIIRMYHGNHADSRIVECASVEEAKALCRTLGNEVNKIKKGSR